jgi:hypothetical protein
MTSIEEVKARRDKGIHDSADHAGGDWIEEAVGYLEQYTVNARAPFLGEQVRAWAEGQGLAAPPDGRAWGAVMQAGRRRKLIVSCGYAPAKSSNLSPKVLWHKVEA